jgi:hypothetical protein
MPQNQVNFLMLQFSRRFGDEAIKMLLVDSDDGGPLQIWTPPDWAAQISVTDQAYVTELMKEWRNTPPDRIAALLSELCRQSQGPIRLLDRGRISRAECQSLIEAIASSGTDPQN